MKNSTRRKFCLTALSLSIFSYTGSALAKNECPEFLNHEFKKLHSSEKVNICNLYKSKPMVLVNTASHCGYTKQFGDLEKLYKKYKEQGVEVVGFSSNAFRQAAKSEKEAATICYKNFGVTFTMLAPTKVRGKNANPVFSHLAKKSNKPSWNFNKYLMSSDGSMIKKYGSDTKPLNDALETDLKALLEKS